MQQIPDERIIQIPYTTSPSMERFSVPWRETRPNIIEHYVYQKKLELKNYPGELCVTSPDCPAEVIEHAAEKCGLKARSIEDLALQMAEDVAIMRDGKLAAICFCFPSGWVPAERIGMLLSTIHEPVADSHKLVRLSQTLAKTMADPSQGCFRRYVWTVSSHAGLSHHPNKIRRDDSENRTLYFRVETQTSIPIGDQRSSLFAVKIDMYPLQDLLSEQKFADRLMASLNSMSDAVLDYKNLREIRSLLNRTLRSE